MKLGELTLTLVPEFENIQAVETAIKPLMQIMSDIEAKRGPALAEMVAFLHLMSKKPRPAAETIAKALLSVGMFQAFPAIAAVCMRALTGDTGEETPGNSEG